MAELWHSSIFIMSGTEKGISLFALPNFNLYSMYMKKIHPLNMFILSLRALEKQD